MNDELKWLDGYSGQTTDELISLDGQYRTDSLVLAFEEALDQKSERLGTENLTEEEIVVLAIEALEREVNNRGYDQFFVNTSREYVSNVVEALNRIGCGGTVGLTQQALDALKIEGPITSEAVGRAIEKEDGERDVKLNECDTRYFETAGDLARPLFEFIKSNRDKITL